MYPGEGWKNKTEDEWKKCSDDKDCVSQKCWCVPGQSRCATSEWDFNKLD